MSGGDKPTAPDISAMRPHLRLQCKPENLADNQLLIQIKAKAAELGIEKVICDPTMNHKPGKLVFNSKADPYLAGLDEEIKKLSLAINWRGVGPPLSGHALTDVLVKQAVATNTYEQALVRVKLELSLKLHQGGEGNNLHSMAEALLKMQRMQPGNRDAIVKIVVLDADAPPPTPTGGESARKIAKTSL